MQRVVIEQAQQRIAEGRATHAINDAVAFENQLFDDSLEAMG